MPSFGSAAGNVLYLIVCAAPPARVATTQIVDAAQHAGWDVVVIATPAAVDWLPHGLAELTGHPVRTEIRGSDESKPEPLGDAVLVAPATFNTINKWAAGINDTLALGLLNEALGRDVPVAVLPWLNSALRAHPVYDENVTRLSRAGVKVADTEGIDVTQVASIASTALQMLAQAAAGARTLPPAST
jgi:phosphopantothenoylcysteine decarboxylase